MDPKSPSSDPPPPDPDDFSDFLKKKNDNSTFDNEMLRDIADNGLDGKFKNTYDEWFHDKVIKEVMEEDEE